MWLSAPPCRQLAPQGGWRDPGPSGFSGAASRATTASRSSSAASGYPDDRAVELLAGPASRRGHARCRRDASHENGHHDSQPHATHPFGTLEASQPECSNSKAWGAQQRPQRPKAGVQHSYRRVKPARYRILKKRKSDAEEPVRTQPCLQPQHPENPSANVDNAFWDRMNRLIAAQSTKINTGVAVKSMIRAESEPQRALQKEQGTRRKTLTRYMSGGRSWSRESERT